MYNVYMYLLVIFIYRYCYSLLYMLVGTFY
nr:MAG TPA: hypothetical protein [Caudoviricetes sp.]